MILVLCAPPLCLESLGKEVPTTCKKERKMDDSDIAIGVKYGVALSSSWSKSICNHNTDITRIKGVPKIIASFQR